MTADWADLWCRCANVQVTVLESLPNLDTLALKDLTGLNALKKLLIALLVSLLDVTDKTELSSDLCEALLLSYLSEVSVHSGPLVVLASCCVLEVLCSLWNLAAVEILEPKFSVNALVARSLGEDVGNLLLTLFCSLGSIVAVLVGSLRLTSKSCLEVLLCLRILKIYCHFFSSPALTSGTLTHVKALVSAMLSAWVAPCYLW